MILIGRIDDVELWPGHTVSLTSPTVPHSSPTSLSYLLGCLPSTPYPTFATNFSDFASNCLSWLWWSYWPCLSVSSSPDWCTGMMNHPPIPISELAEHTELLKANDNLKLSQEYEVRHILQKIPFCVNKKILGCTERCSCRFSWQTNADWENFFYWSHGSYSRAMGFCSGTDVSVWSAGLVHVAAVD